MLRSHLDILDNPQGAGYVWACLCYFLCCAGLLLSPAQVSPPHR